MCGARDCAFSRADLQEQLEELQGQLLTKGLEAGRELVTGDAGSSLAAEFEAMTVDEVGTHMWRGVC